MELSVDCKNEIKPLIDTKLKYSIFAPHTSKIIHNNDYQFF